MDFRLSVGALGLSMLLSSNLAAQTTIVTPTPLPAPPGSLIAVNNGAGDQSDPHVSGNLVSYSNTDGTNFTVRYVDLSSLADNGVPNPGTFDFLADVNGPVVAFTRVSQTASAIYTYDTSVANGQPVEIAPQPGSNRQAAQIGASTIAWQDFGFYSNGMSDIVAYDVPTGVTTRLTSDGTANGSPAVSADGSVIAWTKCQTISAPCDVWSAVRSGSTWTTYRLTSNANGGGNCSHPDTNGQLVVYSCDRGSGDHLFWQPAGGGAEQGLGGTLGQESTPSIAAHFVAFSGLQAGGTAHDLYVLDLASLNLYQITNTPADEQLSDISVTASGQVNVVWQVQNATLDIYAYTFEAGVPFSSLSAQLVIAYGTQHGFALNSVLTLGAASNGINPATDPVTLVVGSYSVVFPAGSFIRFSGGSYYFAGTIDGVSLRAVFVPLGGNTYDFAAAAPITPATANPVPVSLTVGDDGGATSVNAFLRLFQ